MSKRDAIILCGGLGTRLRSVVADRPKVLAEVAGRPLMDFLIEHLQMEGFRIILAVGHQRDQIMDRYRGRGVEFSVEESPLGTGGAVKHAEPLVTSDTFLAMNGDTLFTGNLNLVSLNEFHDARHSLATIGLVTPRTEKDYGAVRLASDGKISRFNEKTNEAEPHFMSAGVYAMDRSIFELMPREAHSLETDLFPRLVGKKFYGFPMEIGVFDIGTPERYQKAQQTFLA